MSGRYPGTVYLLHFDRPIGNPDRPYRRGLAQHYVGWSAPGCLLERIAEDTAGGYHAPKIMQAVAAAGIGVEVARLWEGGRAQERRIKSRGGASRFCPMCGVQAQAVPVTRGPEAARRPPWWPPIGGAPRPRSAIASISDALIEAAAAAGLSPPF